MFYDEPLFKEMGEFLRIGTSELELGMGWFATYQMVRCIVEHQAGGGSGGGGGGSLGE
jgi:hypothetical protein